MQMGMYSYFLLCLYASCTYVHSYGGILTALLRYQYPSVFDGALAGSAPVYMTAGLTDSTAFYEKLTQVCIIVCN